MNEMACYLKYILSLCFIINLIQISIFLENTSILSNHFTAHQSWIIYSFFVQLQFQPLEFFSRNYF